MTDHPLLPRPEQVHARWLTEVLEQAGVAGGGVVDSVQLEGDIGTGQAARSVRYRLEWDRPDARPSTLVGKFPAADEGARATLAATGGYWKEWCFYTRIASTVQQLRVPSCHVALYDPDTADFVLLMEDLADATQGDQLVGLHADQLSLAVDQAAALHGPRFGDPTLEHLLGGGPTSANPVEAGAFCEEMYAVAQVGFLERFESRLDRDVVQLVERVGSVVAAWFLGTGTPSTLLHFDFRADNLLYGAPGGRSPITVVDFQAMTAGVGATDLAYLIGGSVADRVTRAAIEGELLDRYRHALAGYGVEQSATSLWHDYRHGALWGLIMTVLSSLGTERTDRGDEMFVAMARCHAHHVLDLDAFALLS